MPRPRSVAIFCEIIDNFGDIGVCWRLARQLSSGHGLEVTLVVDNLMAFHRLCSEVEPHTDVQNIAGVCVVRWVREPATLPHDFEEADLVIEAFGCRLSEKFLHSMAARQPRPVWINLEYLSAEPWVEGCHGLASPHPTLPLIKYFFFPGFTNCTGGLLFEDEIVSVGRMHNERGQGGVELIAELTGHTLALQHPGTLLATLFCYPQAPVMYLFNTWQNGDRPVVCFVPEGVARQQVETFLGQPAQAGASCLRDSLHLCVIPFLSQPDYDRLLRACHLNFVRGEDSFVRAQWAKRPFVWHIYPQDDEAHLVKLDAFLDRYTAGLPDDAAKAVRQAWYVWNGAENGANASLDWWPAFADVMPCVEQHGAAWASRLWHNGDLARNLIEFAAKFG